MGKVGAAALPSACISSKTIVASPICGGADAGEKLASSDAGCAVATGNMPEQSSIHPRKTALPIWPDILIDIIDTPFIPWLRAPDRKRGAIVLASAAANRCPYDQHLWRLSLLPRFPRRRFPVTAAAFPLR